MNTPERSYPRAPQIEANPKDAEDYIGSLVDENEKLRDLIVTLAKVGDFSAVHTSKLLSSIIRIKRNGRSAIDAAISSAVSGV